MPGYVMHIAVATKVLKRLGITDKKYIDDYMLGSIAADAVTKEQKKLTHFWTDEEYKKLVRTPSLDLFMDAYKSYIEEPFVVGYYCHLYFDKMYLDGYWHDNFMFYDEKLCEKELYEDIKLVKVKGHEGFYDRFRFFSDELFYGDYDKMNRYIICKFGVDKVGVENIPDLAKEILKDVSFDRVRDMVDYINKEVDIVSSSDISIPRLNVLDINQIIKLMDDMIEDNYIFAKSKCRTD